MHSAYYILGYLCGKCHGMKGVSALLNKCVSCEKASIALIVSLGKLNDCIIYKCTFLSFIAIIDIIVITSILVCSTSITSWLYPFLFYLQVKYLWFGLSSQNILHVLTQ